MIEKFPQPEPIDWDREADALSGEEERRVSELSRLNEFAYTDPLTKISNRRAFDEHMQSVLGAFSRSPENPVSVIIADIDHFKHINDTYGHEAGDTALRGIAAIVQTYVV